PSAENVDRFVSLIDKEISPLNINTLILRVDYNYQYKSHPELAQENPLTQSDVDKIVEVCAKHEIAIVPQINLLGHQSWAGELGKLLEVYPHFDETPEVNIPAQYEWPNDDGLYCKSYCPQHPEVHKIVFALVDEIVEVFEADAFHAGLDEVFYIGHKDCSRCNGYDPAVLFADEVNRINRHLTIQEKELWMWGDRLIDGRTTGIGMWEGSYNNTWQAIDRIDKNVVICDWHYERADPTAAIFASKGFRVATCPWRNPDIAVRQENMMRSFIENATPELKNRYLGMIQTVWSSAERFISEYRNTSPSGTENTPGQCF